MDSLSAAVLAKCTLLCSLPMDSRPVWMNFFHEIRTPNTMLSTPKFGMLGAGVSQALGAKAAERALEAAGLTAADVELIIVAE